MRFQIMFGPPWDTLYGEYYDSPAAAKDRITVLKQLFPNTKFRIQQEVEPDNTWKEREQSRFDVGGYKPTPINDLPFYKDYLHTKHFLHWSRQQPDKFSYTESAEKGARDIQTRINIRTYIDRFLGHLSQDEREALCDECETACGVELYKLKFAETADEIERVYNDGPSSCMTHSLEDYNTDGIHPSAVYGEGSDLAVAYLEYDGSITARVLVWPDKKRYSRFYGDRTRLKRRLQKEGYTEGSFSGARLARINAYGDIVCPYIDTSGEGACHPQAAKVEIHEDHLIFRNHNEEVSSAEWAWADSTEGTLATRYMEHCANCNAPYREDDGYNVIVSVHSEHETWCSNCASEHTWRCDHTGELVSNSVAGTTVLRRGHEEYWGPRAVEDAAVYCEHGDHHVHYHTLMGETVNDETVCSVCQENMHLHSDGRWSDEPEPADDETAELADV